MQILESYPDLGLSMNDHDFMGAVNDGKLLRRGNALIVDGLDNYIRNWSNAIAASGSLVWSGGSSLHKILIGGGGCIRFDDAALSSDIDAKDFIVKAADPVFANLRGYLKLCRKKYKS